MALRGEGTGWVGLGGEHVPEVAIKMGNEIIIVCECHAR